MADTQRILHHIAEMYAKARSNQSFDSAVFEMEEKLSERFDDYDAAFADRLTADVIKAVDDFWRFKSDKVRPTLAQILAMENADVTKKDRKDVDPESLEGLRRRILKCADEFGDKWGAAERERYLDLARQQWPDVDLSGHEWVEPQILGCQKNSSADYAYALMRKDIKAKKCLHLLPIYNQAVKYVIEDVLSQAMPTSDWRNLDYAERVRIAESKGLFGDFGRVLVDVCRKRTGKEYQLAPVNFVQNALLAAHWTGESDEL